MIGAPKSTSSMSIGAFKGKNTGKSNRNHGKIWLVSGFDFPFFVNPLTMRFPGVLEDYPLAIKHGNLENPALMIIGDHLWMYSLI